MFTTSGKYIDTIHSHMNEFSKQLSETENNTNIVKLYLKKNENDEIFVEGELQQHHIDGIRFLYRQYQKKNSGVIINAPESSLLVVLFLGAIKKTLNKPILILTDENQQFEWINFFQKHTNFDDEALMSTSSVSSDRRIKVSHRSILITAWDGNHEIFTHHDWSIVVVDTDNFILHQNNKKLERIDFKIWLLPVEVESNSFPEVYQWLHPKEIFMNPNIPKNSTLKDVVSRMIDLETYLEDTLFKLGDTHTSSNRTEKRKISLKNKDATGTKIKRSKKVLNDVTPSNSNSDNRPSASDFMDESVNHTNVIDKNILSVSEYNKSNSDSDIVTINNSDQSDEDVESFIRNMEPINDAFNDYTIESDSNSGTEVLRAIKKRNLIPLDSDNESVYELETQEIVNENSKTDTFGNFKLISDTEQLLQLENKNSVFENQEDVIVIDAEVITKTDEFIKVCGIETIEDSNGIPDEETNRLGRALDEDVKTEAESQIVHKEDKSLGIDSKISDHEDRLLKKFKGSLLDSIF